MISLLPPARTLRRLERLRLQWRVPPGAPLIGSRRGLRPGSTREFLGLRPYEVGDDVRDLDWAATSRLDRLIVRQYSQQMEASLLLLIDASASMGFGDPAKLRYAQELAATLGYLALAHHDRVGAVAFTDRAIARLPAERGRGQWSALRELLAQLAPRGPTSLADLPAALAAMRGRRGLAVILSDFYGVDGLAASLPRLRAAQLSLVAIHLLSPQELEPGLTGDVELVDAESGEARRGWVGERERAEYRRRLAVLRARVVALCRECGIRYVPVVTTLSIARCLEDTLLKAGVLGRAAS